MTSRELEPARSVIVLDHVSLTVTDLDRSRACYDAILAPLGLAGTVEYLDPEDAEEIGVEAIGYAGADEHVVLWLVVGSSATSAAHIALRAVDTEMVAAFAAAGRSADRPVLVPPRTGRLGGSGPVSAIATDPDGNLIEAVVAHEQPRTGQPTSR